MTSNSQSIEAIEKKRFEIVSLSFHSVAITEIKSYIGVHIFDRNKYNIYEVRVEQFQFLNAGTKRG